VREVRREGEVARGGQQEIIGKAEITRGPGVVRGGQVRSEKIK